MALERKTKRQETVQINNADIEWIKMTMLDLKATVTQINQTIVGNEQYGQKGLVKTVEEHGKYIEEHKSFKAKLIGGGIVMSALWSVIMNKIFN